MRTFCFLVSMTIAVHLRFTSSFSLTSQILQTLRFRKFGTARTTNLRIYPSGFQNIKKNKKYPLLENKQRTTNSMCGVSLESERDRMGNEKDRTGCDSKPSAKLVPSTDIEKCGEHLRQGGLVAFPTETVYGLGCNALDSSAIIKVFEAKERPLTDPLITHVTENKIAYDLWSADIENSLEGKVLQSLCEKFWPGPLTLVAKAAPEVPPILMANTGFCACRSPQHPISVALINAAKVPIAAPSANKFGHVSPTRSSHVWHDLKHEDVWIVEEQQEKNSVGSCCEVGVESSVAKIEMINDGERGQITLLRQGAVSIRDIEECLEEVGLEKKFQVVALTKRATDETVCNVAPGQTIRHYSPNIPSFILSMSLYNSAATTLVSDNDKEFLSKSVLIDFGGRLKSWEKLALAYRDLSKTANSAEATNVVFETLRWAENVDCANQILFPEISDEIDQNTSQDALALALKDRLTRAASGVVINCLSR